MSCVDQKSGGGCTCEMTEQKVPLAFRNVDWIPQSAPEQGSWAAPTPTLLEIRGKCEGMKKGFAVENVLQFEVHPT